VLYRESPRCINCLRSGHLTRRCRAPPDTRQRASVHSRLLFLPPDIRSRLTFPPESIHSRISFPALSYAAAVQKSPAREEDMASDVGYVAGFPHQRPCILGSGGCGGHSGDDVRAPEDASQGSPPLRCPLC
jgi:hypothetical protein